jgi:hypothetical protein
MASQVAHIIYAQTFLEKEGGENFTGGFEDINREEFLLGCVFPDIRRIDDDIRRRDTHIKFARLDLNFSGLTSFEAGWKFHLFCDMRREEILNKHGFYSINGSDEFNGLSAKLLEDELLYGEYDNWEKLAHYFNNPPLIETGFGVKEESFNFWYAIIAKYFQEKVSDKTIRSFLVKQNGLAKRLDEIMRGIGSLRKNTKAVKILENVRNEIV